jgi:hypothetical protein
MMKNKILVSIALLFLTSASFANEYQKVFACSETLKNENENTNHYIAKDVVLLPSKVGKDEGVNFYTASNMYFCKLPAAFFKKSLVEKPFAMKVALPNRKALFISYKRSLRETQNFEAVNLADDIDRTMSRAMMAKLTNVNCVVQNNPRNEKIFTDFIRSRISLVYESHAEQPRGIASTGVVDSLRTCQRSFLLKSTADKEIAKFSPKKAEPVEGGMYEDSIESQARVPASN